MEDHNSHPNVQHPVSPHNFQQDPAQAPPAHPAAHYPHEGHDPGKNTAVEVVWQWVSYSLWEGALIALAILLSATLTYFFKHEGGDYTYAVYVLAAMLCLYPLAFVANKVYTKKEPVQKHGFAAVIMVINALGVFIATIGALITAVVSALNILVGTTSSTDTSIIISSSLIVFVLGGLLFIRIINPHKLARFVRLFPYITLTIAAIAVILTIAGPFKSDISSRQDRLIQDNIYSLTDDIQQYTTSNKKLPPSLDALAVPDSQGEKELITRGLVTYEIISNVQTQTYRQSTTYTYDTGSLTAKYKLCVTYKKAAGQQSKYKSSISEDYIDSSNHASGLVCYNQTTY